MPSGSRRSATGSARTFRRAPDAPSARDCSPRSKRRTRDGGTSPEGPFRELAERLPRRGLLVLVSDLLGPPERFLPGLRYFRHRKHEVVVFHVLDPAERSLAALPSGGEIVDAETGRAVRARPEELAEGYGEELEALERLYRDQAHDRGFDWVAVTTSQPVSTVLGRYLASRRHRL